MSNLDILLLAIKNIFKNKLKFALTMVSIVIGVTSVVIITTVSDFGQQLISQEFESMGIDGLAISSKYSDSVLSVDLAKTIEQNFAEISEAMPIISKIGTFETYTKSGQAIILGVDNSLYETLKITSLYGTCFTSSDINLQKKVCVIDEDLAQLLYGRSNIIGKEIYLTIDGNLEKFEICAIISNQTALIDSFMGENSPNLIYIPYTIMQTITNTQSVSQIAIRATDDSDLEQVKDDLEYFLSKKREIDNNFEIQNINSYMENINNITFFIALILAFIGSISLIVATIGVTNMMFCSAIERKKEIGIYMALGAKSSVISKIFLAESVLICLFSGALGVIMGIISAFYIAKSININFYININYVAIIFAISILSGIISGIAPAIKASHLNPIDVLRE